MQRVFVTSHQPVVPDVDGSHIKHGQWSQVPLTAVTVVIVILRGEHDVYISYNETIHFCFLSIIICILLKILKSAV